MSREIVDSLAKQTLNAVRDYERLNLKRKPIVLVGHQEAMAILAFADFFQLSISGVDRHFMGCVMIEVRLATYFNVCIGIERDD